MTPPPEAVTGTVVVVLLGMPASAMGVPEARLNADTSCQTSACWSSSWMTRGWILSVAEPTSAGTEIAMTRAALGTEIGRLFTVPPGIGRRVWPGVIFQPYRVISVLRARLGARSRRP